MRALLRLLQDWEDRADSPEGRTAAAAALLSAAEAAGGRAPAEAWHRFLGETRRPRFLQALATREDRYRWAEAAIAGVRASRYSLATLLGQRVREHPQRPLFLESPSPGAAAWTYEAVSRRLEQTAAVFLRARRGRPRVAILSTNGLDAACADLACLVHGIPVSPLNPDTDPEALGWILDRLKANVVVAGTDDLRARAERAPGAPPHVSFLLDAAAPVRGAAEAALAEAVAAVSPAHARRALEGREPPSLDEPATVMFTSGSTGLPKGVVHTGLALVAKRFARAAALPAVGEDERLLSYLPLFHTFGRYLEMMGMLFWGGTYVFAGNPSFDTLARALPQVRPTGLVGVPRRWEQLRERCLARGDGPEALREVAGDRLRWGLSAAGHLDPAVFRYFQRRGVELCSGFGMTEATGGITMTPPGEYEDGSVGVLLPGIEGRLSPLGELEITGPYVGRYLDDPAPAPGGTRWLATGDVFVRRPSGHFEIVDRVKDVYKNTRGQTVAPASVERRLAGVAGVKRAFLVGDGRDHNVLLIVPDRSDAAIAGATADAEEAYFSQLVGAVNRVVAPPERVVSFALLDRDFDPERELTPKGSYRRKEIARSFAAVIGGLYRSDAVEIACGGVRARLPRWFYRDLGLLEADVVATAAGLLDRRSGRTLPLAAGRRAGAARVGDLEYDLGGDVADLGLFARQPVLWAGNVSLRAFAPCKDGWDVPLGRVSPQVRLPAEGGAPPAPGPPPATPLRDAGLAGVHEACARALFAAGSAAVEAVEALARLLPAVEPRLAWLVRRRLETLAWHPDLEARCLAYRTLLLDEPVPGYGSLLASFVESGQPFLTEASVEAIARARPDTQHLEALRRRLLGYRQELAWPASYAVREAFRDVLSLLARSARLHPAHVVPVRAELAAWALFEEEPELAAAARAELAGLAEWCRFRHQAPSTPALRGSLPEDETDRLSAVIGDASFLAQSVAMALDEPETGASPVGAGGVWLSPLPSTHSHRLFRASFQGGDGRHRDLLLSLRGDVAEPRVEETVLWMTALGDPPSGPRVVPRFGCARGDLGALSTAFVGGLTVWERLRELAEARHRDGAPAHEALRFLFVRGLAAFFAAWQASERRILPGQILPTNVVVPEPDYRSDVRVLSLAGWRRYEGPGSLVEPMHRHFFEQAAGHYPALGDRLDPLWIAEAAAEGLGPEAAGGLLDALLAEGGPLDAARLRAYRERLRRAYRPPLALEAAVARYARWRAENPRGTASARLRLVARMLRLYALEPLGDLARYTLYRRTYFAESSEAARRALDTLLVRLFERPGEPPTRRVELSEVQAALVGDDDRRAFGELVFPLAARLQEARVSPEPGKGRALVVSRVADARGRSYTVREPLGPAEIGRLYRLLSEAGLQPAGSPRHLVLLDSEDRVAGGITWRAAGPRVAHLEGIVLAPSFRGLGLAEPLVEDFCARLASTGYAAVHTDFGPGSLASASGFRADRRWGGLVRKLVSDHS